MNANEMTFGIEIECSVDTAQATDRGLVRGRYHAGAAVPNMPGWRIERDASVRATKRGHMAIEVVSPILQGTHGLAQVEAICALLNDLDATINPSCGFHVHVGWSGDDKALRRLVRLVAHYERALFAATGTTRREHNFYCTSIRRENFRQFRSLRSTNPRQRRVAFARYHTLNLTNLYGALKQTVEFRIFEGTRNAEKIAAYVQMVVGLVQKALDARSAVKFDARDADNESGALAMKRLIWALGWTGDKRRETYGLFDSAQLKPVKKTLRRLAKKYDAARAASQGGE